MIITAAQHFENLRGVIGYDGLEVLLTNLWKLEESTNGVLDSLEKVIGIMVTGFKEINTKNAKFNIAKITGSAAGIIGGIISAAGFGLSFVTAGAPIIFLIAGGGAASVAGGATVGITAFADKIVSSKTLSQAEEMFKDFDNKVKTVFELAVHTGDLMALCGDIDVMYPNWTVFWASALGLSPSDEHNGKLTWEDVRAEIATYLRKKYPSKSATTNNGDVEDATEDSAVKFVGQGMTIAAAVKRGMIGTKKCACVLRATSRTSATAFRSIGSAAGKALHVAGGVANILFIPSDALTLLKSCKDLRENKRHDIADDLQSMVAKLTEMKNKWPLEHQTGTFFQALRNKCALQTSEMVGTPNKHGEYKKRDNTLPVPNFSNGPHYDDDGDDGYQSDSD